METSRISHKELHLWETGNRLPMFSRYPCASPVPVSMYHNTLQCISNQNTIFFIPQNTFESVDCKMEATLFRFHWADLTHCGRETHICVGKLTIIGSDNGLSPGRRQAIIWTNSGILLIGPLGTSFSEILIGIQTFSFRKMRLKMSSAKWRPFCLGLNELTHCGVRLSHCGVRLSLSCATLHWQDNGTAGQARAMWRSEAMSCYKTWSTLTKVMACCLTAPSHYLNQCWLIIIEVLWHSPHGNFTGNSQDIRPWFEFENEKLKFTSASPRVQ